MLQQRKKDFLLQLIEEFFKKLQQLVDRDLEMDDAQKLSIIDDCHVFFSKTFNISAEDDLATLIEKIDDNDLLEQYARLLYTEFGVTANKQETLNVALEILNFLQNTDKTYSWERTILREDILRKLDQPDV